MKVSSCELVVNNVVSSLWQLKWCSVSATQSRLVFREATLLEKFHAMLIKGVRSTLVP